MNDKSKKPPDDVFSGPGFKMVRRGRYLELTTQRSPEEQRELNRRMQEMRPQILAEIERKTTELRQIIHKYTSLDLVANLLLRDVMHDPNEYEESDSKLRPHWVEHATVIELMDPKYELRQPVLVEAQDIERAHALLEQIFMQTTWYYLAEVGDPKRSGPPSRIDELRFATLLHGMSVRSPAYSSHWRDVLLGLFGGDGGMEWLSNTHNLDVHSALATIKGIEKHLLERMRERLEEARTARKDFLHRLNEYKATGRFKGDSHEKELFDRVRNMRGKDAKRYVNYMLAEWTRVALGTVLSFDSQCIAKLSGVAPKNVQAFLAETSLEFGISCRDALPAPVNILSSRITCAGGFRLSQTRDYMEGGTNSTGWGYLSEGPARPNVPDTFTDLTFTSYTDSFDAYFLCKEGQRTIPATRPSQPLPKPMDSYVITSRPRDHLVLPSAANVCWT